MNLPWKGYNYDSLKLDYPHSSILKFLVLFELPKNLSDDSSPFDSYV